MMIILLPLNIAIQNRTMTLRYVFGKRVLNQRDADNDISERDTMDQRIGPIDEVIAVLTELVDGTVEWEEACRRLPAYDGVQALD
jgi:hypothetical protein